MSADAKRNPVSWVVGLQITNYW